MTTDNLFKRIITNGIVMDAFIKFITSRAVLGVLVALFAGIAAYTKTQVDDNICNLNKDCQLQLENVQTGLTETIAVVNPVTTVSQSVPVVTVAPVINSDVTPSAVISPSAEQAVSQ